MSKLEQNPDEISELKGYLNEYNPQEIKNIDLLYRSMNDIYSFLIHKRDQLEQNGTPEELTYLNGQIAGYKLLMSVINAFFDH
jgi:hypothetical protein